MKNTLKISSVNYYVQSKKGEESVRIVGHSTDETTGEVYFKFLHRKEANKLLKEGKKVEPEYKYRVIKETTIYEAGEWQ